MKSYTLRPDIFTLNVNVTLSGTSRRQPASKSKAVDLDDVLEVREGWGTQVFRRTSKKQTSATEMCCFSLILKARSLDLSCATPVSARRCVLGFRELTNVDGRTIELDPVPYPPREGEQIILDLYAQYVRGGESGRGPRVGGIL